jgi:hypothetical protein
MEASANQVDDFLDGALAELGIEVDEVERAVVGAAHQVFWGPTLELLALDTQGLEPERNPDLSKAP